MLTLRVRNPKMRRDPNPSAFEQLRNELAIARAERNDAEARLADARLENARLRERLSFVERAWDQRRRQPTVFAFHH